MRRRFVGRRLGLLALIPVLGFASACNNILEWSTDDGSYEALMASGRTAIQEADYAAAEENFARAVELEPNSAEARYYHAKATVLNGEVDIFSLVRTLTNEDNSSEGGAVEIFGFEMDTANTIYRVNTVVVGDLEPIRDGVATIGDFAVDDVNIDLAVAFALRGILRLRDTNGDGVIDATDVSIDDLDLVGDDGEFNLDGIDNIPPEDINNMIEDFGDMLEDGSDLLEDIVEDSGFDIEELEEVIDSLGGDLSIYYVNTGIPGNSGEGDNDNDGRVDEECLNGIDDDGDGIVDEDTIFGGDC